ncbi:hypothetical protein HGRIS_008010 [Hohenbuehelia grisea]|uniref:Cas1p 10 TM acyl transferase domain-containing protein n=1 Tax=Hohenbuehelia grisea TaxID=104357 RepID=A0ABR3J6M1_9AGAR
MSPAKLSSYTLNPFWVHYASLFATVIALVLGLGRLVLSDGSDIIHCEALLNRGRWLDAGLQNWQPDGCMVHKYQAKDSATCLGDKNVVFAGDSVTRKLFFQFAHTLEPTLPSAPDNDGQKHSDHHFKTKNNTRLSFYWDPFLNGSDTKGILSRYLPSSQSLERKPSLLVLGTGLWYLRYANGSGGLPAWEATIESILTSVAHNPTRSAHDIVILPVEEIVSSKLSPERALTMQASDIDAMNSDLYHRLHPWNLEESSLIHKPHSHVPISFPLVFNRLLDPSQTDDGLHFSDSIVQTQANILLNLRCNEELPKRFPLDKTCCRSYPRPLAVQSFVLLFILLCGPFAWFATPPADRPTLSDPANFVKEMPSLVMSAAIALIYLADRTWLWEKEHKHFDPWVFGFLCLASLALGLGTLKSADNELGFLNREQTDEWKGWMQIAILIYHYVGASKISGIYNPIRVLVASYLFMTGYGHTTYYLRKADFGIKRIAQILVRLNLLTVLLAYVMNTDYISYYFAPLVSMWFLIIYGIMAIGARFNDRTPFLLGKIFVSAGLITWFMHAIWPLELLFDVLEQVFNIHWSAREWTFRVNLDLWIVFAGMLTAILVVKSREYRLTDHPQWPLALKCAIATSAVTMVWFFAFELLQESKFTYNKWHPYISVFPVVAFVILRNANIILRSATSRAFAFVGRCSLETFIIQYHFWLGADSKGVLVVIPGAWWRPVNLVLTTCTFIYVSHMVAQATAEITRRTTTSRVALLTSSSPSITPSSSSSSSPSRRQDDSPLDHEQEITIPLFNTTPKDLEADVDLPPEPDTPFRPHGWRERAYHGSSIKDWAEWRPGLRVKLVIALGVMWACNLLWTSNSS